MIYQIACCIWNAIIASALFLRKKNCRMLKYWKIEGKNYKDNLKFTDSHRK